jgi:hypothetical protein
VLEGTRAELLGSARCLGVDRVAGEVAGALGAEGVDSMLVKGAAVARLLYDDGAPRRYHDCDLLVRHADVPAADAVLERLGFERPHDEERGLPPDEVHAHTWVRRGDRAHVDLHWTFIGLGEEPFDALRAGAEIEWIGGRDIAVPAAAATALIVTLQLLQHGQAGGGKHRRDVERALDRLDEAAWRDAAALAHELDADSRFGAGLRLASGGDAMAERLGLPDDPVARALASGSSADDAARWLERTAGTPGLRGKVRVLARLVFPRRSQLEFVHPSARRGGLRLAFIYALRPFRLAARTPTVLATWRRARKEANV